MRVYEHDVMQQVWKDNENMLREIFGWSVFIIILAIWVITMAIAVEHGYWVRLLGVVIIPPSGLLALILMAEARDKLETRARDALDIP